MGATKNMQALTEFVEINGIERDDFGRCRFRADVVIRAQGKGGADTVDARVSFASGDIDQFTFGATNTFEAGELPLGYKTDFNIWSQVGGKLTIKGKYKKLSYTTEVTPEK